MGPPRAPVSRQRSGRLASTFVDVSARSADLPESLDRLPEEFALLRPKAIRVWTVVEEVLKPAFRGLGLAPAVQRALLAKLDLGRAPHVFGTIDGRNIPSLKTAARVGRQVVEVASFNTTPT